MCLDKSPRKTSCLRFNLPTWNTTVAQWQCKIGDILVDQQVCVCVCVRVCVCVCARCFVENVCLLVCEAVLMLRAQANAPAGSRTRGTSMVPLRLPCSAHLPTHFCFSGKVSFWQSQKRRRIFEESCTVSCLLVGG